MRKTVQDHSNDSRDAGMTVDRNDNSSLRSLAARRRWARRRGNSYWLWPEVDIADWSGALEQIA